MERIVYVFEHNNVINLFILLENIFDMSNSVQMSNFNSFRVKKHSAALFIAISCKRIAINVNIH